MLEMAIAILAMTGLAVAIIVISRIAMRRILSEKEKLRLAEMHHQQELLANSINVQERVRKRIAGDMHDELSSRLNILKLSLYKQHQKNPDPELRSAGEQLDEAITIARDMSHEMYPPLLSEFGLEESIRDYLQPLEAECEVDFRLLNHRTNDRLDKDIELNLFRIIQELTQNSIKHADSRHINILLRLSEKCIALSYRDSGKGFSPEENRKGLGLKNIESRVQVIKGHHKWKSSIGKGCSFIVLIS